MHVILFQWKWKRVWKTGIIENKINKRDKILPKIKNLNSVEKKIKHIDNEQLKISLKNFLKAYNEKND